MLSGVVSYKQLDTFASAFVLYSVKFFFAEVMFLVFPSCLLFSHVEVRKLHTV